MIVHILSLITQTRVVKLSWSRMQRLTVTLVRGALASGSDAALWRAFSTWLSTEVRATSTLDNYRMGIRAYLEFLHSLPEWPAHLDLEHDFRVWMLDQQAGLRFRPETMRTYIKAVRLLQIAVAGDDAPFLHRVKGWNRESESIPFTSAEILFLLEVADPLMRLIVILSSRYGLRSGEIRRIQQTDVDWGSSTVLRISLLDEHREDSSIPEDVAAALGHALLQSQTGLLFPWTSVTLEKRFERLCYMSGIKAKPLSALRLYCGAQWVRSGDLAAFFGLRSRSSLKLYRQALDYLQRVDSQESQKALGQYILPTPPSMSPLPTFPSPQTLRHLLEREQDNEFIDLLSTALDASPVSKKNILSGWRLYLRWVREKGRGVLNADQAQAEAYAEWLKLEYQAPATINNRLVQVRKLYRLLLQGNLVENEVFKATHGVVNPAEERRLFYTDEEITRLLAHATPEERLLVLLGAHVGLTGPELLALQFEDFQNADREVQLRKRIGHLSLPSTKEVRQAIQEVRRQRGEQPLFNFHASGRVFEYENDMQLRSVVFMLCKKANVLYKGWRSFRNYAGIKMLRESRDARKTAEQLGIGGRQALNPTVRLVKKGEKE